MGRQRRKPEWASQESEMDALATALRNRTGEQLRAILKRDKAFTFRLSEMDRETMDRAAKALEIPVAEYLIRLHYHAYDALKKSGILECN